MWRTGPVAPRHVGSSRTRARTRVPCIGRQILNHCATREVLTLYLMTKGINAHLRAYFDGHQGPWGGGGGFWRGRVFPGSLLNVQVHVQVLNVDYTLGTLGSFKNSCHSGQTADQFHRISGRGIGILGKLPGSSNMCTAKVESHSLGYQTI